jgi:hypothetical protein
MDTKMDITKSKVYRIGRNVRLTGGYCGRGLSVLGWGIMAIDFVVYDHPNIWILLLGALLVFIGDFMDTKHEKIKLKWYQMRRVKSTGEYWGGTIMGFGLGLMLMPLITDSHSIKVVYILGITLTCIGNYIAFHAQRRNIQNCEKEDPHATHS